MIDCKRQFRFEAAHRIYGHKGACSNIHGHSYRIDVALKPSQELNDFYDGLNDLGMVIDFSDVKKTIGKWIDDHWDHAMIIYDKDPLSDLWGENKELQTHKVYYMATNPTAENMARFLGVSICPGLLKIFNVEVTEVIVWETENCCARWTKDGNS